MPQPADPRIFHTHIPYAKLPKGGRMITCYREPLDMLASVYPFMDTQLALKGRVSKSLFHETFSSSDSVKHFFCGILDWWEHRHDQDVLFLFFDDLKENHEGCVRRIAWFIGVECTEEEIACVVHTTTHSEMFRHHDKFDSSRHSRRRAEILGDDPPTEFSGRVRKGGGTSGEGEKTLPQEVKQLVEQMWREVVEAKLGFKDTKEMREAWIKERGW